MSQTRQAAQSAPAAREADFIRRNVKRLDAWLTAQLEASDPAWCSDPKVSEFDALPKGEMRRCPSAPKPDYRNVP